MSHDMVIAGSSRSGQIRVHYSRAARWLRDIAWHEFFLALLAAVAVVVVVLFGRSIGGPISLVVLLVTWFDTYRLKNYSLVPYANAGRYLAARLTIVVGFMAAVGYRDHADISFWAFFLIGLATLAEPFVRRLAGRASAIVSAGPELSLPQRLRVTGRGAVPLFASNTAALFATILLARFNEDVLALATGLLAFGYVAARMLLEARNVLARFRTEARIHGILTDYAPEFALYWSAPSDTSYQIGMWLPYLERLGRRYIVVTRTPLSYAQAAVLTTAPVLYCRDVDDLDRVVVPSLRVAFYVNNAARNMQFVRYPHLKHVMLNHGESDKPPSYNPASRMYDRNLVAGQAAIERFTRHGVDVFPEQFAIVGRPQLEQLTVGPRERGTEPFTVLYAPTWRGYTDDTMHSSIAVAPQIVRALVERGLRVLFRPHRYSYSDIEHKRILTEVQRYLAEHQVSDAHPHIFGSAAEVARTLEECIDAADALVSDVSSVVADFLYTERPMILVSTRLSAADFVATFPISGSGHVCTADLSEMPEALDDILSDDRLAATRRQYKFHYLGMRRGDDPVAPFFTAVEDIFASVMPESPTTEASAGGDV